MSRSTLAGDDGRLPLYPLAVERVSAKAKLAVRMLSDVEWVPGIMTHFIDKRSRYCDPDRCNGADHKREAFWKGYLSAEKYDQAANLWIPICLEVTEGLELDLRHRYARGQVWELYPDLERKKKHPPIRGRLLERRPENTFPAQFDLMPCLLHLYHVPRIVLNVRNPLPDRTMVQSSAGPAPARPSPSSTPTPFTPEMRESLNRTREKLANGFRLEEHS